MSTVPLTAAAQRALDTARRLAVFCQMQATEVEHLLAGLVYGEALAAELLSRCGLQLSVDFPEVAQSLEQFAATERLDLPDGGDPGDDSPPLSDELLDILVDAGRLLRRDPQATEVGSEHLLWSLARSPCPVTRVLAEHGLTDEWLTSELTGPVEIEGPPLEVSFSLTHSSESVPGGSSGAADLTTAEQSTSPSGTNTNSSEFGTQSRPTTNRTRRDTWRILDAAANRCREGLRVVEDFARFVTEDDELCRRLKSARHDLAAATGRLDASRLLASRDTPGDIGTRITTAAETNRLDAFHVVTANLKRVQESLRSLEEFSKLVAVEASRQFEALRYQMYDVERTMGLAALRTERLTQARLYLLVTEASCRLPLEEVVKAACDNGADVIQMREKQLDDSQLRQRADQFRAWTAPTGTLLIINDRPDIARDCGADGVHVGQEDCGLPEVRRLLHPDQLIGHSTHSIEQARESVASGADYLGVGPTFPSRTKQFDEFAGLDYIRQVAREIEVPWFALGGIDLTNIDQVLSAGARGVALTAAICQAEDPALATRQLARVLQGV